METRKHTMRAVFRCLGISGVILLALTAFTSSTVAQPGCGNTFFTNAPADITGPCCQTMQYDFNAQDMEWDVVQFRLVSGPGQIDEATGVWTWQNVPPGEIGAHELRVQVGDYCMWDQTITLNVRVDAAVTAISSGCGTTAHLTGDAVDIYMGSDPAYCPSTNWTVSLVLGNPACTYSIGADGLLQFSTTVPDVYVIDIVAHAGEAADTCSHTFIVHGGQSCCSGMRGNVNATGIVDLADLSALISYLMIPYAVLGCQDEANVNGTGIIDLGDLSMLITYLTGGQSTLPNCF